MDTLDDAFLRWWPLVSVIIAVALVLLPFVATAPAPVAHAQLRPPDYSTTAEAYAAPSPLFPGVWDIHLQSYHPAPLVCEVCWQGLPGIEFCGVGRVEANAHRTYGTTRVPKLTGIEWWCWEAQGDADAVTVPEEVTQ